MQQASAHRVLRMHAWDILAPTEVFRLWVRPVGARGSGDEDAVGIEYAHCTVLPDLSRRHQAAQSCPDNAVPCLQSHCLFFVLGLFFFLTSVHTASLNLTSRIEFARVPVFGPDPDHGTDPDQVHCVETCDRPRFRNRTEIRVISVRFWGNRYDQTEPISR